MPPPFGVRRRGNEERCRASHAIDVVAGEWVIAPAVVSHENRHGPGGADILNADLPVDIRIARIGRRFLHTGLQGDAQFARPRVVGSPSALEELTACSMDGCHMLGDPVPECVVLR